MCRPVACLMPSYIPLVFPVLEASSIEKLSFIQYSFAQRLVSCWLFLLAFCKETIFFLIGSFLYWIRADLFAAVKGSITLRFALYQLALFLTLLPHTSTAALYVALQRLFHFAVASVDKLLCKLLSKEEVKCLILSALFVWPVLTFGNPFGFAWWSFFGDRVILLRTREWSVSQSPLW